MSEQVRDPKIENRALKRLFGQFSLNFGFHQFFVEISGNCDPLRGKFSIFVILDPSKDKLTPQKGDLQF